MMNNFSGPPNNQQENENNIEKQEAIKNLQEASEKFKAEHSLELLFSITDKEEAVVSPERSAAKEDLKPLFAALRALGEVSSSFQEGEYEEIKDKYYNECSRAVGMINKYLDEVDHTR